MMHLSRLHPCWTKIREASYLLFPINANKQGAGPLMSRNLSLKFRYAILLILLGLIALFENAANLSRLSGWPVLSWLFWLWPLSLRCCAANCATGLSFWPRSFSAFPLSKRQPFFWTDKGRGGLRHEWLVGATACHCWALNMRGSFQPKNPIRNPALRFTKPSTRSTRICCARPSRPRLAQRSLFSAIPSLSEKG